MNKNKLSRQQKKRQQKKKQQKKSYPIDMYFLLGSTILLLPLVFIVEVIDPTLMPRLFGIGIVVGVFMLISVLYPKQGLQKFQFLKLYVFPAFLLYLVWSIISISYAINPSEGLFDITRILFSGLLLVFATQIFIKYENASTVLVKFVILSSIFATAIGLYQYFENVPGHEGYDQFMALYEVKGLMAHKNQYSVSLFLMLPFAIYGVYSLKGTWWWLSIYSTLTILISIVILQTRSVWVALVVFLFVFILLWLINKLKNREKRKSGFLKQGLIIGVITIVVASGSILVFHQTGTLSLMKKQVSSIFDSNSGNNQGRLKMWPATWELAKDNFVVGVGAGNWKINILPYYNRNFGASYQNWRRPHNDFLWVLSEKGIIGLLLYLALFVIVGIYTLKLIFSETDKKKLAFTLLMMSAIMGYMSISMVTFPMERTNHQVYLMIMIAGIVSTYYNKENEAKAFSLKTFRWTTIIVLFITVLAIVYSGMLIRSEYYLRKTINARMGKNWKMMNKFANESYTDFTRVDPYSMPIQLHIGVSNINMKKNKLATRNFSDALHDFPTSIAVLNNLAIVSAESNDHINSIYYFNKSLEIFPNYSTSAFNLVKAYYKVADYKNAYIALLNCDSKNTVEIEYDNFMSELSYRINSPDFNIVEAE